MRSDEIRTKYLEFFKKQGHAVIPSAPIVPENDPTTLFTGSGMQPLVPYLLGKSHPVGTRLVNSQKCFRAMDIEEVGDNRHTTFFEMLGNWSLGDYFKKEQLPWFFEFLTDEIGLDPRKLYVTAFLGDSTNAIPRDNEAAALWIELFEKKGIDAKTADIGSEADGYKKGMGPNERIFFYDAKKNWWSRAGTPDKMPAGEPGGPDSEVFYEFTDIEHDKTYGAHCHPNCDCGRFLEIGNSVFMEYVKNADGTFGKLPKANVDFGGGLERIAAVSINSSDVFRIDVFAKIISLLEEKSGSKYADESKKRSFRIIADHLRAAAFAIADGVLPSNVERGYFVRRLLRRAIQHSDRIGLEKDTLGTIAITISEFYADSYPELGPKNIEKIATEINQEEERFRKTLDHGLKEFERFALKGDISGANAFMLFTTYGFPFELTRELTTERGLSVDERGFRTHMEEHQKLSRAGSEQKFKGGLADTAEKTVRLHTAHHLLLKALQIVLGPDVHQRGSNITQERLRIDFSYDQKMTDEQKREVERIVNEKIREELPVVRSEIAREEAETLGAEHEFGAKYPERVSVYSVGPKGATLENPHFDQVYSIEFCGGPHVSNTKELGGTFKIQKEEAVSAGVRRIKAVLV